jgi:hypothetical protein
VTYAPGVRALACGTPARCRHNAARPRLAAASALPATAISPAGTRGFCGTNDEREMPSSIAAAALFLLFARSAIAIASASAVLDRGQADPRGVMRRARRQVYDVQSPSASDGIAIVGTHRAGDESAHPVCARDVGPSRGQLRVRKDGSAYGPRPDSCWRQRLSRASANQRLPNALGEGVRPDPRAVSEPVDAGLSGSVDAGHLSG